MRPSSKFTLLFPEGGEMSQKSCKLIIKLGIVTLLILVVFVNLPAKPVNATGSVIRVKPTGATTGTCGDLWTNACSLQYALTLAAPGDEIWAAKGTYRPALPYGSRESSFQLKNGVAIYGGFSGSETSREDREWQTNLTILTGDLNFNDDGLLNLEDNSYHVVLASGTNSSAILDGFYVVAGNADGSDPHDRGAGINNVSGSPTLRNLVIQGNRAQHGAGMSNRDNATPILQNVTFIENIASLFGGGMTNSYSTPVLIDVNFIRNSALGGGGINIDASSHTLINVGFYGNSANYGGGINAYNSNPNLTNTAFVGNVAAIGGGGLATQNSCPILINTTFAWNSAPDGGAIHQRPTCGPTISNSILWGNGTSQISGSVAISFSLVENGYPGISIITVDPLFATNPSPGVDEVWGTPDDVYGNLQLTPLSPAIDFGDMDALPADIYDLDNDGNLSENMPVDFSYRPRVSDDSVDLGIYEFQYRYIYLPWITK